MSENDGIHFRYEHIQLGAHVHVDVRVGRRGWRSTHAIAGSLVLRPDEFVALTAALAWSVNRGETEFVKIRGDDDGNANTTRRARSHDPG